MSNDTPQLISVNFKLAPAQVQQLTGLAIFFGSRTRAMVVALDALHREMLRTNPAYAEWAGVDTEPPDETPDAPSG